MTNPNLPPDDEEFENPYAAPRSTFAHRAERPRFAGIDFTVSDVFNWSWKFFKERPWPCIGIFWGVIGLTYAFNFGTQLILERLMIAGRDQAVVLFLFVSIAIARILVQAWLGIGMSLGLLKVARNEPVSFEVIFTGGRSLLTMILAGIVVFGLIALPVLVVTAGFLALAMLAGADPRGGGVGTPVLALLLVVWSGLVAAWVVFWSARLMQFYFLVIDREVGVFDSIQWSWRLTKDRVSTIVLVYLVQVCVGLAGLLACCVGLIPALPLSSLISVVTYLALTEPAKAAAKPAELVWEEGP